MARRWLLSLTFVVVSGCGQQQSSPTEVRTVLGPSSSKADLSASAQTFLNSAAAYDRFQIAASGLALRSAQSPQIRQFASDLLTAHLISVEKVRAAGSAAIPPVVIKEEPSPSQQRLLASLEKKAGAEFDTAYMAAQVEVHDAALRDQETLYYSKNVDPTVRQLAADMIPNTAMHLNLSRLLRN